jgi:hypothetical protein
MYKPILISCHQRIEEREGYNTFVILRAEGYKTALVRYLGDREATEIPIERLNPCHFEKYVTNNLDELEAKRKVASRDQDELVRAAELCDFYDEHWDNVIAELRAFQDHKRRQEQLAQRIFDADSKNIAEFYKNYES